MVHTCFISKHTFNARINSPSPFNFLHSSFKSTIFFPTEEVPTFSWEKGGIVGTMDFLALTHCSIGSDPVFNRPGARACSLLGPPQKWPKAVHCIKATREPTRQCSPRTRLGPETPQSAISSHMRNLLWENTQSRYLSLIFLISKSFILKNNP